MTNKPIEEEMPEEIDFSKAVRGLHHIPAEATVFLPALIEENGALLEQGLSEPVEGLDDG